ncbi:NAD-dependent epimerase/dehydratase family protein [Catellatospora tritici]|uniref:NAD-dependent epimerase/dehydratase family protein n=1 Tax=Catellatospora tritici TaxID=2851566 RepID=UPI001C2DE5DE|nr:NAD-dependent epimerase/dehydratase family protein [Catellatospora tritici]MBV1849917.1 NAD-dependent epimerase/dehydratase family protein [Catellatospora tritici]
MTAVETGPAGDRVRAPRVVIVTGISRFLGATIAARIAATPGVVRVIGVDRADPPSELRPLLRGVRVHRIDLTEGAAELIDLGAEALVHLAVVSSPDGKGGRAAMKDQNVIGTMQLLAACQQMPSLRRLVLRSSTAAYGASFRDPAVFTEDTEPRAVPRGGYARDILDIEGYVRGFRRRNPRVTTTVLRFTPFVGPRPDTGLLQLLAQPVVPTVLGRDPRLQFIHVDDALELLYRSVVEDHQGVFNVAGPGTITLSQAIRRLGRIALPVPEGILQAAAVYGRGVNGLRSLDQVDLFVHGRVVDTARLTEQYGFTPRSTAEAFDDFVRAQRGDAVLTPGRLAETERRLLEMIRSVRAGRTP